MTNNIRKNKATPTKSRFSKQIASTKFTQYKTTKANHFFQIFSKIANRVSFKTLKILSTPEKCPILLKLRHNLQ